MGNLTAVKHPVPDRVK